MRSHGSLAALPFPWSNAGWAYRTGCIQTPAGSRRRVFLVGLVNLRVHDHLNCGIVGTLMRGGGGAATVGSAVLLLGLANILAVPICAPRAAFGRLPPIPVVPPPRPPPPRANEAAGVAKTMNNAIVIYTEVFDIGKLHYLTH